MKLFQMQEALKLCPENIGDEIFINNLPPVCEKDGYIFVKPTPDFNFLYVYVSEKARKK